jgi:hypothetical protein
MNGSDTTGELRMSPWIEAALRPSQAISRAADHFFAHAQAARDSGCSNLARRLPDLRRSLGRETIATAVSRLFLRGRPPTIVRLIVSIIVDTLDRHALRRFSHVFQEGREVSPPALTNADTAPAVTSVCLAGRRVASVVHRVPRPIGSGPRSCPTVSMGCESLLEQGRLRAPARFLSAAHKLEGFYPALVSAMADDAPRAASDPLFEVASHCEVIKPLACHDFHVRGLSESIAESNANTSRSPELIP